MFYLFNGYEFDYGEDIRLMLKLLAVRENLVDPDVASEFFAEKSTQNPNLPGAGSGLEMLALWLGTPDIRNALETALAIVENDHND